ncbi:MAG: pilus assembly protein PilY [Hahellaceae bacterium]|nr:pilus assembly protein PilY [Hahellaceae bacterium]
MIRKHRLFTGVVSALFTVCSGLSSTAYAAELALSDSPLFIKEGVDPNMIVTLDDSGSMAWGYVPDGISGTTGTRRFKASNYNGMYYNPDTVYLPPRRSNGTAYSTSFTTAYEHGFQTSGSWNRGSRNLSNNYRPTYEFNPAGSSQSFGQNPSGKTFSTEVTINGKVYPVVTEPGSGSASSGVAAYYYVFQPNGVATNSSGAVSNLSGCPNTNPKNSDKCYRLVKVGTRVGPADIDGDGDVDGDDEKQNFANWYSFYRTRVLATASAASLAFQTVSDDVRVAYQNLHKCAGFSNGCRDFRNSSSYVSDSRVRSFTGSHRDDFYEWLSFAPASGGTPLRSAMARAGTLLSDTTLNSPYAKNPGTQKDPMYACRPSFHIAMTDGIWNGDSGLTSYGNYDSSSRTAPGGCSVSTSPSCTREAPNYGSKSYTSRRPYNDSNSNTLSDIVFSQWIKDAQPTIANQVPIYVPHRSTTGDENAEYWDARNDPAEWQHMTTFMVGFGLGEVLVGGGTKPAFQGSTFASTADNSDGYAAIVAGTKSWPTVGIDDPNNPYDMWHAAVNGRGEFFSADDPNSLVDSFQAIIAGIQDREGSAASVALDAGVINGLQYAYHARFNSTDWTGDLVAYELLAPNFDASTTAAWSARNQLNSRSAASRNIKVVGSAGSLVDFTYANLTATQKAMFNLNVSGATDTLGSSRISYLRGDRSNEGSLFRPRAHLLGDIIHSSPVYVGPPTRNLLDEVEGQLSAAANSYTSFKTAQASRNAIVFVGSNDGMLHAFDADDGSEVFAFVPTAVLPSLRHLTYPGYTHRFTVDGPTVSGDIFDGTQWRSIVVGTLRNGGKSVFALDVTDTANISVLWEFTDTDLGYVYNKPAITRLHNGQWGVIIGNGYNSTNHRGVLYVLNATTGAVMKKFDTGAGALATPNGLATPSVVDINGDLITDYVYAGDLLGNVWRFDLINTALADAIQGTVAAPARSNAAEAAWSIGYGGTPLFTARDEASPANRQPVTSNVVVAPHQSGSGILVMFGTGKYLEAADASLDTTRVHTYYGIWDRYVAGQATTNATLTAITRSNLQEQTLSASSVEDFTDTETANTTENTVREVSANEVDWWNFSNNPATVNKQGWYIDFQENGTNNGEMLVTDSLILGSSVIFASSIPNDDPCEAGVDRWIWALDVQTGGKSQGSVFDLNNDGEIDSQDQGPSDTVYNSVKIDGFGAPSAVGERIYLNLDAGIQTEEFDSGFANRRSWRLVR